MMVHMQLNYQTLKSPIGDLFIIADSKNLHAVIFEQNWIKFHKDQEKLGVEFIEKENALIKKTKNQLNQYFAGKRKNFDLPYKLQGTSFQKKAWQALSKIGYGKTKSYKDQAILVTSPKAVRAIGSANSKNPLCIILPCHRVIASSGKISGYAGGVEAKKFLLKLERR